MVVTACRNQECDHKLPSGSIEGDYSEYLTRKYLCVGPGYTFEHYINSGSFGDVWIARNTSDKSDKVAVKVQFKPIDKNYADPEVLFYIKAGKSDFIPKFYHYCQHMSYSALVLEILGPNLGEVFKMNSKSFSLRNILLCGLQMIRAIEFVHSKNFVHGDIKSQNFLIRVNSGGSQSICLVDFGFSKEYIDSITGKHVPLREGLKICGTIRYISINIHRRITYSRRDDLESLAYLLMYFIKGYMPWDKLKKKSEPYINQKILVMKETTNYNGFLNTNSPVWNELLTYSRKLEFDEIPDYEYCYKLLMTHYQESNYTGKHFDWNITPTKKNSKKHSKKTAPTTVNLTTFV